MLGWGGLRGGGLRGAGAGGCEPGRRHPPPCPPTNPPDPPALLQAQTVANFYLAFEQGLEIVPLLNKIDMQGAEPQVGGEGGGEGGRFRV